MKTILRFILAWCLAYTLILMMLNLIDGCVLQFHDIRKMLSDISVIVSMIYINGLIYDKIVK